MNDDCDIKIKEIFESIQGEGPYIGVKQLFIRFCNCNFKCNYCDTDFLSESYFEKYTPKSLLEKIRDFDLDKIHSISLTGGEPLLSSSFLKEFLPFAGKKIYLETNATLADKLLEVKPFIDIVSADIKLESSTGIKDAFQYHDKFFQNCRGLEYFAKIVFDENITDCEIENCANLAKKYEMELILQPKMLDNKMSVSPEFAADILDKFLSKYNNVRLIPQVHKFLNVR